MRILDRKKDRKKESKLADNLNIGASHLKNKLPLPPPRQRQRRHGHLWYVEWYEKMVSWFFFIDTDEREKNVDI